MRSSWECVEVEMSRKRTFEGLVYVFGLVAMIFLAYVFHSSLVVYQHNRYDDNFKCVDFSREAVVVLKSFGFNAYLEAGEHVDGDLKGRWHCWVRINFFGLLLDFEPQDMFFFDAEDKFVLIREYY